MTRQDNMEAMQRAEEASVILGVVSDYVNNSVNGLLANMVSHYRGGSISHDVLVGGLGEISALMAMVDHLKVVQRTGEQAAEKEFTNGKGSEVQSASAEPEQGARPGTRGAKFRRSQPT